MFGGEVLYGIYGHLHFLYILIFLGHEVDVNDEEANDDYVECNLCGDHIMKEFLERHLKMNHPDSEPDTDITKECPVCEVQMKIDEIVQHCEIKHKTVYKYCR